MSAKTDESGEENYICLNYFRFLGPIAEWEKKVGSMDFLQLSGGLLVNFKNINFLIVLILLSCLNLKSFGWVINYFVITTILWTSGGYLF
jgi:hypothetical protein